MASMLSLVLLNVLVVLIVHNGAADIPDTQNMNVDSSDSKDQAAVPMPSSRVINGFYVSKTSMQIPWIVSLQWNGDGDSFCTGSLINEQYVLTAAHCVAEAECKPGEIIFHVKQTPFKAVIGEYELNSVRKNSGTTHDVIDFWIHEEWKRNVCRKISVFDFAVLKLRKPVKSIRPVCLDDGNHQNKGKLYNFGYGRSVAQRNAIDKNKSLKGIEMNEIPRQECKKKYGSNIDNMVCVKAKDSGRHSGTCAGDSGGPLVVRDRSFGYRQIGVHSYGTIDEKLVCSNIAPGVSSRISLAYDWITSKVGKHLTC